MLPSSLTVGSPKTFVCETLELFLLLLLQVIALPFPVNVGDSKSLITPAVSDATCNVICAVTVADAAMCQYLGDAISTSES